MYKQNENSVKSKYVKHNVANGKDSRSFIASGTNGAATLTAIAKYILEMRYLTVRQIKTKFFSKEKVQSGSIKSLLTSGLVTTKGKEINEDTLIVATTRGFDEVSKAQGEKKTPQIEKSIFQPRVRHDLLLNDLRIRFEELGFLNLWVSETMMKEVPLFLREFPKLPDAVCIKKNNKGYFLELEVALKGSKAYRERIKEYQLVLDKEEIRKQNIEGVVFMCTDSAVAEVIKKQIPEGAKHISVLLFDNYFPREAQSEAMNPRERQGEAMKLATPQSKAMNQQQHKGAL